MPPTTTGRLLVKDRQGLRDQPAGCRETLGGPYPRMSARQRRTLGDAGPPGSTGVSAPPAPLFPFRHVVRQFARGDPLSGAPVSICDIVLEILAPNAPEPPAPNLKSAKLSSMNEVPDEAAFALQFFGDLLDGQKAALAGFSGHPDILM